MRRMGLGVVEGTKGRLGRIAVKLRNAPLAILLKFTKPNRKAAEIANKMRPQQRKGI